MLGDIIGDRPGLDDIKDDLGKLSTLDFVDSGVARLLVVDFTEFIKSSLNGDSVVEFTGMEMFPSDELRCLKRGELGINSSFPALTFVMGVEVECTTDSLTLGLVS